jgi:trehalose-phosphatase
MRPAPPPPELAAALTRLAGAARLLVASDYDGVLAPIVPDPARAVPLPEAVAVLDALARLPDTAVAVVSGRARDDLAARSRLPEGITLVGSHGAEFAQGFRNPLTPAQVDLHARLCRQLRQLAADRPGVTLEAKPASVAVHTRNAARPVADEVVAAVRRGPATWPGVYVTTGKEVVELSVIVAGKGAALAALRAGTSADAVLFLGDDVTDEDAFATLHGDDVGIKVGPGPTVARFRVPDPPAAVAALKLLSGRRAARPGR